MGVRKSEEMPKFNQKIMILKILGFLKCYFMVMAISKCLINENLKYAGYASSQGYEHLKKTYVSNFVIFGSLRFSQDASGWFPSAFLGSPYRVLNE